MSAWDAYPSDYRAAEVRQIQNATRAGECVMVVGLSGAGKSNLMGFLYHRAGPDGPSYRLIDGNRAQPRTAGSLFVLIQQALGAPSPEGATLPALEQAVTHQLNQASGGLCLLLDRYDALSPEERGLASGPLRALRDAFKYQLTYVVAVRRPLAPADELAELFYANTLWLGPLAPSDARWSASQYATRRGLEWNAAVLDELVRLSWGYPSLLRACAEAHAAGAPLELVALREHPAVQRRVQEFWADSPTPEDLRRSGLKDHPLLSASQPILSAESAALTASEHRLLACFQGQPGIVLTKDDLIRAVWPEDRVADGLRDDSLAQLIRRLRQKIGSQRIQTIPGRGYQYLGGENE